MLCFYCTSCSAATTYTKELHVKERAVKHSEHPQIMYVKDDYIPSGNIDQEIITTLLKHYYSQYIYIYM